MRAHTITTVVFSFALALLLASCAPMTPEPYTPEDMARDRVINQEVNKALALGGYSSKVTAETHKGVVTLRGMLVDRTEADDVMNLVGSVSGVRFIRDEFDVQWDVHDSMFHWGFPGRR